MKARGTAAAGGLQAPAKNEVGLFGRLPEAAGLEGRAHYNGDGSQRRSFCYVEDPIEGLVRLINSPEDLTGPIILGNLVEFTNRSSLRWQST